MDLELFIPTYNRTRLLEECLKSVFRASRPQGLNITVVIVDNNSCERSRKVVQPFLEQSELPCRYIHIQRPGKSAALNEALAQTHAELVGFVDDDEQLDAAWFEVAYREMSGDSNLDYIGGPYHPNWEVPLPEWLPPITTYGSGLGIVHRPERIAFSPEFAGILMGGNIVIRRATLEKVLPYPEKLGRIGHQIRSGMDELIHHRLLQVGARGESVPDLIIYHWIPAERMTKQYYRKWAFGRGVGEGYQFRERTFPETALLGIPRYKFGKLLRCLPSVLFARDRQRRFLAELSVRDCFGLLYGRHIYGRFQLVRRQKYSKDDKPVYQ